MPPTPLLLPPVTIEPGCGGPSAGVPALTGGPALSGEPDEELAKRVPRLHPECSPGPETDQRGQGRALSLSTDAVSVVSHKGKVSAFLQVGLGGPRS